MKSLLVVSVLGILSAVSSAVVLTPPTLSNHRLALEGDNTASPLQGVAGFFRIATGQGDSGHGLGTGVVQNSPDATRAYYYLIGAEGTPHGSNPTDTAFGASLVGLANTANYFTSNGGGVGSFSLRFGPTGNDPTKTWNLGADTQGADWHGSAASTIEERIYQANPADVSAGLYYAGTEILTFGYSPLYMVIDYGATTGTGDDTILAFSDPVTASKKSGLSLYNSGLADALLADINAHGGQVQLNFNSIQPATREDFVGGPYLYGAFAFQGSLQVVPEPSEYALIMGGLALLGAAWRRVRITRPPSKSAGG